MKSIKHTLAAALIGSGIALASTANAGNILLTGHDVLLHGGQDGYDDVALDFLRNGEDASTYSIAVIGSGVGFWNFSEGGVDNAGGKVKAGYESTTYFDTDTMTDASWDTVFSSDLMIILSHTSCGGCDLSDAGVAAINARSADIATAFNGGMDIWANSGARNASYYDFLPPGATTTGPSISGSTGFTPTAEGTAIGFTAAMMNGNPTHNRFADFDPDFTVFETRGSEVITIGLLDGTISGGGIDTGPKGVPEASTLGLFGLGLLGLLSTRRKKQA